MDLVIIILPVVTITKDLPISPRFTPYDFLLRCKFSNLTTCQLMVEFSLSLRNLISGYECGRVFPAGVGPGSPSRDAVNWLPSRFSLSVETRRRFGWLRMMVFPGAHLFRAPIWCPSGGWRAARERQGALSRRAR